MWERRTSMFPVLDTNLWVIHGLSKENLPSNPSKIWRGQLNLENPGSDGPRPACNALSQSRLGQNYPSQIKLGNRNSGKSLAPKFFSSNLIIIDVMCMENIFFSIQHSWKRKNDIYDFLILSIFHSIFQWFRYLENSTELLS